MAGSSWAALEVPLEKSGRERERAIIFLFVVFTTYHVVYLILRCKAVLIVCVTRIVTPSVVVLRVKQGFNTHYAYFKLGCIFFFIFCAQGLLTCESKSLFALFLLAERSLRRLLHPLGLCI